MFLLNNPIACGYFPTVRYTCPRYWSAVMIKEKSPSDEWDYWVCFRM
jgi:hypothetical protein